jgi:N-acetyl-anhydromuramoyl-L-alanine amidase
MQRWQTGRPGWLGSARARPSPNFDARPPGAEVSLLVIHYISLPPGRFGGDAIERLFTNRLDTRADPSFTELEGLRVSSHFLIRRRGELLQFVSCDKRAWHAGLSQFQGRRRCNDFSIGVELEGDGDHAFTQAQYRRLKRLVALLIERYRLRFVAGHSDIAPGRKDDPGPRFDWNYFVKSIEFSGLVRPFPPTSRATSGAAR